MSIRTFSNRGHKKQWHIQHSVWFIDHHGPFVFFSHVLCFINAFNSVHLPSYIFFYMSHIRLLPVLYVYVGPSVPVQRAMTTSTLSELVVLSVPRPALLR